MALTEAQVRILKALKRKSPQHRNKLSTLIEVLMHMEDSGLIASAQPFANAYHTTSITPAGLAALAQSKGGEDGR